MPDQIVTPVLGLSQLPVNAANVAQFATANTQFAATATGTAGNTLVETSLIGTGIGSLTLAANALTVGKSILISCQGTIGSTLTPTLQLRGKIGGTIVLDTGAQALSVITGTDLWQMSMYLAIRTIGAGGTGIAQGQFSYFTGSTIQANLQMVNTATFAVNTTITNALALTAQWGTADPLNTISCTNFSALLLGG